MVTVCFPSIVSLNLLTHGAKVDFGRSYEICQFQSYGQNLPKFNFHPTDERPEANQWTETTVALKDVIVLRQSIVIVSEANQKIKTYCDEITFACTVKNE